MLCRIWSFRPQSDFAALFRRVDAAVFTNRAEGGTNLVAMEAMAAGVRCGATATVMRARHMRVCSPAQHDVNISVT